jgi:nitrite reductase (cytochrome c-552)
VEITEATVDPAEWGKNFPRQYDSYRRTVDTDRTRHGGSEAFQKLDADPLWRELFAGYAFGIDYRDERGHAYMLLDQRETERVTAVKQPGACLHCHASVVPAYRAKGIEAGAPGDLEQPFGSADARAQLMAGFEAVCAMPYEDATQLVEHPVSCLDCHDPDTMQLRATRPAFLEGIAALARSGDAVPHLPSIGRWRQGEKQTPYDPNVMATRQEMRTLVCAQCHVEYYFRGEGKLLVYPWENGLTADDLEAYYDDAEFADWTHLKSRAPMLKAQHPEFELWSQGIHARSGVACADCHMPYVRDGALKVSDHHVRSPLLNINRACQTCHRYDESEILARVVTIQDRTQALMIKAEEATVSLIEAIEKAAESGLADESLARARDLHRRAQWRLDFVAAENSMGFHAAQESARLLGEAIDYARQGEIEVLQGRLAADGR